MMMGMMVMDKMMMVTLDSEWLLIAKMYHDDALNFFTLQNILILMTFNHPKYPQTREPQVHQGSNVSTDKVLR